MGAMTEQDVAWCRSYVRKAVKMAFTAPPEEPHFEPARATWHVERNARLLEALGAAGEAYEKDCGVEPNSDVLAMVRMEARPYFTNPYPGDNILSRASRTPNDALESELAADRARERLQRISNVAEEAVSQWERTIQRALSTSEREELLAWLKASATSSKQMK